MTTAPNSESMAAGRQLFGGIGGVPVLLLVCLVCHNMGVCYAELSQLDKAEEALSQSLSIVTSTFAVGDDLIYTSKVAFWRQLL